VWSIFIILFFFFFQAEDGIRDRTVTGVQTCALPILLNVDPAATTGPRSVTLTTNAEVVTLASGFTVTAATPSLVSVSPNSGQQRSEERRVGKEGRSRWGRYD